MATRFDCVACRICGVIEGEIIYTYGVVDQLNRSKPLRRL
jgi:hypothetical protein